MANKGYNTDPILAAIELSKQATYSIAINNYPC